MSSSHKGERFDVDVLTHDEVVRLIATFNKRLFNGARNRAMVAVMYRAGLRVSELCDLRPSHLDLQVGLVRVQNGKGGKRRVAGIDTATAAYVQDWLQRRDVPHSHRLAGRSTPHACHAEAVRTTCWYRQACPPSRVEAHARLRVGTRGCAGQRHPETTGSQQRRCDQHLPQPHRCG